MGSELSGIFPVKLVTKNIVRVSPGTQFMHMRVKQVEIIKKVHMKFLSIYKDYWYISKKQ